MRILSRTVLMTKTLPNDLARILSPSILESDVAPKRSTHIHDDAIRYRRLPSAFPLALTKSNDYRAPKRPMRNRPSSDRPYPTRVPPTKRVPTHPSKTTLLDRSKPVYPRHATSGRTRQPISRALAFEPQPLTSAWKRSILDSDSLARSSRQPAPTQWSTPRPRPLPRSTESKARNTSIDKDCSSPRNPITPQKKACSSLIRFSKISPALFPPPGFRHPLESFKVAQPEGHFPTMVRSLRSSELSRQPVKPASRIRISALPTRPCRPARCPSTFQDIDGYRCSSRRG